MASGILMVLDDVTALLDDMALMAKVAAKKSGAMVDDVAGMTKVAATKTAGVLGDDLALNAQQVSGFKADKELKVIWDVAVGSMKNKAILIPAALAASAFAPYLITPALMAGGLFLCYEGAEKIIEKINEFRGGESHHAKEETPVLEGKALEEYEAEKVKGAIRTDFILSAEIVVIALGTMTAAPFLSQAVSLTALGAAMTVGVYGAVAGIVKIDDLGFKLMKSGSSAVRSVGDFLVEKFAPGLMKTLTVAGTAAMFLVGGSILAHGISALGPLTHAGGMGAMAVEAGVGIGAGLLAAGVGHVVGDHIKNGWAKLKSVFGAKESVTVEAPDVDTFNDETNVKKSLTAENHDNGPKILMAQEQSSIYSKELSQDQISEIKTLSATSKQIEVLIAGMILGGQEQIGNIQYQFIQQMATDLGVQRNVQMVDELKV